MTLLRSVRSLQGAINATLMARATVWHRVSTADTSGGLTESYPQANLTLPCSYYRATIRPLDREQQPRVFVVTDWIFIFPAGSDIRSTDRIKVGTRTWEVVEAGDDSLEVGLQAYCQEIV